MDLVIVFSTCFVALIALLALARVFARWNSREQRVPLLVCSISSLLYCVGVACLLRGHSADAVFGVVCFIWIAVCVATSYALSELWRRLCVFCRNANVKSFLVFTGTLAVAVLGIVACMRLLQWILS